MGEDPSAPGLEFPNALEMIALRFCVCAAGSSPGDDTGTTGALGSVEFTFLGSLVLAGGATGSLRIDAGLAGVAEGEA